MHRADRRQAEEALAQMTARRHALEELERDRVGLAPAAAALLAARERFDGGVLGPLSDFVSTGREDAELAERLLGDWMHAVLVRDRRHGSTRSRPGTPSSSRARWCCCRSIPGPLRSRTVRRSTTACGSRGPPSAGCGPRSPDRRCSTPRVGSSAGRAAPSSCRGAARALGPAPPPGRARDAVPRMSSGRQPRWRPRRAPSRRRSSRLAEREQHAGRTRPRRRSRRARPSGRRRGTRGRRSDSRAIWRARWRSPRRSSPRVTERLTRAEQRLAEIDAALVEGDLTREPARRDARQRPRRGSPSWRPSRRRRESSGCTGRCRRPTSRAGSARRRSGCSAPPPCATRPSAPWQALGGELTQLEADTAALAAQQAEWRESARRAPGGAATSSRPPAPTPRPTLADGRGGARCRPSGRSRRRAATLERASEESHALQVRLTEAAGTRRSIVERVEAEWRRPFEQLLEQAPAARPRPRDAGGGGGPHHRRARGASAR